MADRERSWPRRIPVGLTLILLSCICAFLYDPKMSKTVESVPRAARKVRDPGLYRFDGPIESVRPSFLYLMGLAVTALLMILLPVLYFGVIAGLGYAVYWHARNIDFFLVTMEGVRTVRSRVFAFLFGYLAPLVAGLVTILFLLKPLIVRSVEEEEPVTLDRSQEPRLYAFIEHLCEILGAPFPNRIDVSTIPNAAASFRRGWLSFFGRDFALHLGLTLAAGMTVRQFAGTIAHELGHFSQGGAMRFSYIIRTMNAWLVRIAYQRDHWDASLDALTQSESWLVLLGYVIKLFVWVARRVIILFVWIGHAVSCSVSRQMEYNADQYEARLTGSEEFARSTRLFSELNVAMSITIDRLQADWRERRLVDNMPMLVAHTARCLPDGAREWVDKEMEERSAGLFSTHPASRKRIEAVQRTPWPGVMHADGPAHALFSNFTMVANGVTLRYYRDVAGLEVSAQNLIPVAEVAQAHQVVDDHYEATGRYFQFCISLSRSMHLGQAIEPASDPKVALARLKAARAKFEAALGPVRALYDKRRELIERTNALYAASGLTRAKVKSNAKEWKLPSWSKESVEAALTEAKESRTRLDAKFEAVEKVMHARVTSALALGVVPAVAKRLDKNAPSPEMVNKCLQVIHQVESIASSVRRIDELGGSLGILFQHYTEEGPPAAYPLIPTVVNSTCEELRYLVDDVRASLDFTPYPFDHAGKEMSAGEFLGPRTTPRMAPFDMFRLGGMIYHRVRELYGRSLGVIASYAEAVEAAVGLPPLPKPAPLDKPRPDGGKK